MTPFPTYIRLGGHVIAVSRVDDLIKTESAFATFDDEALSIEIDSSLSPSLALESLVHECVEACNTCAELGLDDHSKIQTLGLLMHQVFASMLEQGAGE